MKRKWLIAGAFVAVVALLVWANLRKADSTPATAAGGPKNAPMVKISHLQPTDLTQVVLAPGTLEASGTQEVRAPFATPRIRLMAGPGDRVTAGQVLAVLEADDLKVQLAAQEAAVARAEASLAALRQQQQTGPIALAVKLESARAQVAAAEAGLQSALKQSAAARQRLEQAGISLITLQNRAAAGTAELAAARDRLQAAEAQYRQDPAAPGAQSALAEAERAYQDALRKTTESARHLTAELAQAHEGVASAERDLAEAGEQSPAVMQARSQLQSARLSLESAQLEAEAGGTTAEQLRSAQADVAAQRASLDSLRRKLDQAELKAPATGVVLTVGLKDGQPAQQSHLLFEIGALDRLLLKARVDEIDVGRVRPDQGMTVRSSAFPGEHFAGAVTRVAAQSSGGAGSQTGGTFFEVQGTVANPDGKLRSGMSAEARITTETRKSVLAVGLESLREEGEKAFVLVVNEYRVQFRQVKLGLRTQTRVEITEGLADGDQVVVAPFTLIQSLKDGDPVRTEAVPQRGDDE